MEYPKRKQKRSDAPLQLGRRKGASVDCRKQSKAHDTTREGYLQPSFAGVEAQVLRVKDFPERERPLARLQHIGAPGLSLVELLVCLIQSDKALQQAAEILRDHPVLSDLSLQELTQVEGVGPATAARIIAAVELGRRVAHPSTEELPQVHCPADAAGIFRPALENKPRELFAVAYLNTRNKVTEQEVLYNGTLNTSVVRIGEVFGGAMRRNCASIIVAHNHPSGDPNPSPEDIALTRKLEEAGKMLEIELLDHIIIGNQTHVSLRERGFIGGI
ncbi:MAG: DNA repair protein RadC [Anaerolineae bacterium]|nr:DNA repair protein RadC [Anaerolineae bacterium]